MQPAFNSRTKRRETVELAEDFVTAFAMAHPASRPDHRPGQVAATMIRSPTRILDRNVIVGMGLLLDPLRPSVGIGTTKCENSSFQQARHQTSKHGRWIRHIVGVAARTISTSRLDRARQSNIVNGDPAMRK